MILFASSFGGFVITFMSSGINVGLTTINQDFHVSAVYLTWISLSMVLVSAAMLLPFGRLADAYGRMRFFIGSMVLFSVVSFASALAPSAAVLLALRMLIGISLAIGSVTAPALVILAFPIEVRGRALGWNVLGVYLGVTVGPFLGGLIFHGIGWRGFFYVLAGMNLINVVLPVWKLRHIEWKEPKQGRFDLVGSLLYAAGLVALLLGFSLLPGITGAILLPAGVLVLAGFLWWESRAADPLLPVGLLKHNRVFAFANGAVFVNYAATAAMSLLMSYYLIVDRGLSQAVAGLAHLRREPGPGVVLASRRTPGRQVDRPLCGLRRHGIVRPRTVRADLPGLYDAVLVHRRGVVRVGARFRLLLHTHHLHGHG